MVALIPEFRQALVEDISGNRYALTRKTLGVDIERLKEGQRVTCTVSPAPSRVLAATA